MIRDPNAPADLSVRAYRQLGSKRLKATPEITHPNMSPEELAEARLVFEYEQELHRQQAKRGYE